MWPESIYFPVLAAVCVIAFTIVYAIWQRRETESQHETNVDTYIPATLLKHAQTCKRNIHEVPRDDNSLFSALADQLTDDTFTGQSLRDHIETFISGRCPSEQTESLRLQKSKSRQDTGLTIQDAADFLRQPIVLYRDDENPPFYFQPNVDVPDPNFQNLYIGCINNRYYVSFRSLDYNKGQGASVPGNTDSDEDGSDTESENPRALISIGDENETTIIAPGDAERPINLTVINRGNNNRVALNITVSENVEEYVERMIASRSSVGDDGIRMKINASGISREEIERAERNVIKNRIKIQDNINDAIRPLGLRLSTLGKGCLLMCFRPKSWIYCRAFIMGLRLHNEKYLYIFKQLLTAFEQINDSNNLTMDVKISIGQLSEETSLSDCISGTEFKDIVQARDMDKTIQPFEKKDVGKRETTTDPRSGRSVGEDDKLSLKVVVRPVGDKSSLSSTDLENVAVRTMEQVLEFEEADVSYIPHAKTHDQMTTIHSKPGGRRYLDRPRFRKSKTSIDFSSDSHIGGRRHLDRPRFRKSISEKVTKLFTASGSKRNVESVHLDRLGQQSMISGSSGYSSALSVSDRPSYGDSASSSKRNVESVPPYGLYQLIEDSSKSTSDSESDVDSASDSESDVDSASDSESDVDSGPSLSDADKQLRSLLTKNLSDAVRRELARLQMLSINDPDIDGALNTMKWNVYVISSGHKQLGTAFSLGKKYMLTAGHVLGGSKGEYLQVRNELLSVETRPIGISPIADVGVLLSLDTIHDKMSNLDYPVIDFGTESCTYIYVVGYVDGNMSLQGEKCPVLPPRDKDDGYIRFQSNRFRQGSSGSPCLVFKNGRFVFKGILVGREEGTNVPYELIAITFRCLWKRLGLPFLDVVFIVQEI